MTSICCAGEAATVLHVQHNDAAANGADDRLVAGCCAVKPNSECASRDLTAIPTPRQTTEYSNSTAAVLPNPHSSAHRTSANSAIYTPRRNTVACTVSPTSCPWSTHSHYQDCCARIHDKDRARRTPTPSQMNAESFVRQQRTPRRCVSHSEYRPSSQPPQHQLLQTPHMAMLQTTRCNPTAVHWLLRRSGALLYCSC